MFPVLFEIQGLPLATYGALFALAHLIALSLFLLLLHRRALPLNPHLDILLILIPLAALGARLTYFLLHLNEFTGSFRNFFSVQQGGLSFHGAFLFAFPAYLLLLRWKKLSAWETSDCLGPALLAALAVARIGCLGAGCCYGRATHLPWAIQLPMQALPSPTALQHPLLFPVS